MTDVLLLEDFKRSRYVYHRWTSCREARLGSRFLTSGPTSLSDCVRGRRACTPTPDCHVRHIHGQEPSPHWTSSTRETRSRTGEVRRGLPTIRYPLVVRSAGATAIYAAATGHVHTYRQQSGTHPASSLRLNVSVQTRLSWRGAAKEEIPCRNRPMRDSHLVVQQTKAVAVHILSQRPIP